MIRAPWPCSKHSHGAKRCDGGQDEGPLEENVMFAKAFAAADAAVLGLLAERSITTGLEDWVAPDATGSGLEIGSA